MTRWGRLRLVAWREIRERARGRMYVLSTAGVVLAAAGSVAGSQYAPDFFEVTPRELAVAPGVPDAVVEQLPVAATGTGVDLELRQVESAEAGRALLDDGEVDALLADEETLLFREEEDATLVSLVSRARYNAQLPGLLEDFGLTEEQARQLLQPPPVSVELTKPADEGPEDLGPRIAVASAAVIILYLVLAFYGSWILTGVVEEKSSRVVEVLLSALRPEELLAGKVLGILLLGVAQLLAGLVSLGVALLVTGAEPPEVALDVVAVSVGALVLGLLLYAFVYAALGSTANRLADANSIAAPLTIVLLVPYFVGLTVVPEDPDGTLAVVLSFIPFTAPLVMPARVALGAAAAWEVALAGVLMVPAIVAVSWLGGRIYSRTILASGRVGFRGALRAAFGGSR